MEVWRLESGHEGEMLNGQRGGSGRSQVTPKYRGEGWMCKVLNKNGEREWESTKPGWRANQNKRFNPTRK